MEIEVNKPKKSVKKNYLYNLIYQLFLVIVPLVVTPYVSRVLLPEGIGEYSFSYSLINYFTIFGALGFGFYAQREVAKYQNDKKMQSKVFWEVNICRLISIFISLGLNVILCTANAYGKYTILMWIMNINIVALLFDIAFMYQGNEDFGKLVFINGLVKAASILCIFLFVKNENDVWIYTLINSAVVLVANLAMWIHLPKIITKVCIKELKPMSHMKGTIRLFIPTVATSIYTILDKTLIGVLITDTYTVIENGIEVVKKYSDLENGFYEQSEKLVKMALAVITGIGTVMIPRNSNELASGNVEKVKDNLYLSSRLVWLIGIPMVIGFILISDLITPWFFGEGYEKCSILIALFSVLIVIIGFSNVIGLQYLVPSGKDKKFAIALIIGAITNVVLNLILIPFLFSIGATIATVIGELVITIVMFIMVRKFISFKKIMLSSIKYLIAGLIMFVIVFVIKGFFEPTILDTLIVVLIGIAVYFISLIIMKERLLFDTISKILRVVKHN